MPTGTVKQFAADKGFGFITPSDGGDDVFVHRKVQGGDRTAYLEEGQEVEYEVEWSEKAQKYAASSCTGFKTEGGGKAKGKGDKGKGKGKDKGKDGKDGKGKGKGDDKSTRAPRYGNEDSKSDSSSWGVRDISKKLSWVLRNGAPHLGVNMDKDGWVRVDNLLGSEALPKLTTERLMKVIEESNEQKPRYEIYNSGKDDMAVRAGGAKTAANRGERDRRDDRGGRDRRRDRDSDRDRDREPPTSPSLSQALQNLPPPSKSGSTLNASAGEWKPGQSSAMAAASAAYQMQMQMQQAMAYQMAYQQQAWQAMQAAQQGYGGKGGKGKGSGKGGRGNGGGRGRGKDDSKAGKPEAKAGKEAKECKAEAKAEGDAPAASAPAASPPAEAPAPATPVAEAEA